ncbi:hypothetical protein DOM22_18980 [Bdellovibrio sp. ZAP7]|uniref:hypothetical protein n=1 Tax=Bdellovibrio sp. ZAP7 TaxID=2231053 RepID=UPI0011577459|nr:hypothetical protein [Bdellovibrio sp. ZAP7]QDK47098.1 hypothetical protein DOM22_18980 [Bdellovibrio sp. ZAP7]
MNLIKVLILISILTLGHSSFAVMRFVYHAPESDHDFRYKYHWEILKSALDLTEKKFGPYSLTPSEILSEDQQLAEMKKKSAKLTVMIRETNKVFETELNAVKIPIDRNLIGYRVLLIDKKNQAQLSKVDSLEKLITFNVGQGAGWGDISILKNSGFNVITKAKYDDLFKSLIAGEFQIFPRGVVEVLEEYRHFKKLYSNLAIDDHVLLYYPLPTYFWFQDSSDGRLMARRVEEGLRFMIKSGSYRKIFDKHYAKVIRELDLNKRVLIKIPNPYLPSSVPFDRKELWFDPRDI